APVEVEEVARDVGPDRVLELVARGIVAAGVDRLLDLDRDDREAPIAVALVDGPDGRGLELAGRAPRRPEVDPDDLASKLGQADRAAVEVRELDPGTRAVDGELRGEVADAE